VPASLAPAVSELLASGPLAVEFVPATPDALVATAIEAVGTSIGRMLSEFYHTLKVAVETATGPVGLAIIAIYSFLIAFLLPLPSEIVLIPAGSLELGMPYWMTLLLIMLVSGLGKAAGSVFAFHIGQEAKESGPVIRFLRESRFDVVEWSEKKTVDLAQKWGYLGLALALCVPGFPDTLSIYAFTVLEEDYGKFALATFAGSVGRLVVTVAVVGLGANAFI
jgi:membrane protein YqaA with SNARE-associated domain